MEDMLARRDVQNRETQWYTIYGDLEGPWPAVYLEQNSGVQYVRWWFVEPPYADAGGGRFGEQPVITVEEFYVSPFDLLVWDDESASVLSDLRPGGKINFRIGVWDRDSPFTTWRPFAKTDLIFPGAEIRRWFTGDGHAVGLLVSRRDMAPGEAVELRSEPWARIKAAVWDSLGAGRRDP